MNRKWQVFVLVAVSIFMSTLDSSIVNLALPFIMKDLGCRMDQIQWVVVIYLLAVSSLLLTFGRLSDIQGRPLVYISGFLIFTLGSWGCALSSSLVILVGSRAVQGVGAAMLMACSPALIVDAFEPENRGQALGLVGAVVAAGLTMGPVAGGILLAYFSWPSIFYVNLPVGAAAVVWATQVLRGMPQGSREPMDMAGSVLLGGAICSLIIWLTHLTEWGLVSGWSLVFLAAGIGGAAAFGLRALMVSYALFDVGLLKIRLFVLPLAAALMLFAALFTLVFMMPFYLTLACGFSAGRTGIIMIIPFVCLLVVSPISGRLSDRLGSRLLCSGGMACLAVSLGTFAALAPGAGFGAIFWRFALAGLGIGLFVSPNSMALMGAVPVARRGIASGAMATARNFGMVLGVAMASTIFTHTYSTLTHGSGLDRYTPDQVGFFMAGFRLALTAGAGLALAGILVSFGRGPEPVRG